jgi:hypothetical protein
MNKTDNLHIEQHSHLVKILKPGSTSVHCAKNSKRIVKGIQPTLNESIRVSSSFN